MSKNLEDIPQAMKDAVIFIELHTGTSDDYMYQWEELVFVYENGDKELVSRIATNAYSPEDNMLSRIGRHNLLRIVQATEVNPKVEFNILEHKSCDDYFGSQ